jgi:hypothetical protein
MIPFKYQNDIQDLPNCPPADYQQVHLQACRWVFEDDNHPNNFRPPLVIHPQRRKGKHFRGNDRLTCAGHALSFFSTLENARKRYLHLYYGRTGQDFVTSVGTHLAQGVIEESDGVASKIDSQGHFELHEFVETDLKPKFRWIGPVLQEEENHGTY